jgi:hypothetical protein
MAYCIMAHSSTSTKQGIWGAQAPMFVFFYVTQITGFLKTCDLRHSGGCGRWD